MTQVAQAPAAKSTQTKLERRIRKVAILGSGVMGSRIAAHFANIGCEVVLLDIIPLTPPKDEKQEKSLAWRNSLVNKFLLEATKSKPAPFYSNDFASRIKTGNLTDNLDWIADCDLILEAVIERLDIKQQLLKELKNTVEKMQSLLQILLVFQCTCLLKEEAKVLKTISVECTFLILHVICVFWKLFLVKTQNQKL